MADVSSNTPTHDPLDLLRACISASLPLTLLDESQTACNFLSSATSISFPPAASSSSEPIILSKDAPSRYTARADTSTEFYTLGQLYLAWIERETGVRDYLQKGQESGGYVGIADRRAVVDYLQGKGDERAGGRVVPKGGKEAGKAEGEGKAVKRRYEVDVADREFCKKLRTEEIELRDRNSVLRCSNGGKVNNFTSFVQTVMSEKIRALRNATSATSNKAAPSTSQPVYEAPRGAKKPKRTDPIIVISNAPTALITMWNIKTFLEQGIFVPTEIVREEAAKQGDFRAEDMLSIVRKKTGPNGEYTEKLYVVDGVEALQKFGQDAWDRVVAVITTGQTWQFKNYKWQDPRVLFRNVQGIYFQWHNDAKNTGIKDWNVKEMKIDRNRRHTDRQVVAELWRTIDARKRR